MSVFDLIAIGALLVGMIPVGAYGVSSHLMARYIRAKHPILWKSLGEPDLNTAQGPRADRLGDWIAKGKYRKMDDPQLLRWCPILRQLRRIAMIGFIGGFLTVVCTLIARHFFAG